MPAAPPSHPPRQFSVDVVDGRRELTVAVTGDVGLWSVDRIVERIRGRRREDCERVVIDLRRVAFIDTTGLRVLLGLTNDARRDGYRLELIPGPPAVQRTFALTGTSPRFDWLER